MLRLWKFGLIFLTFLVALAVAGREGPEVFGLADDPSNDGDVIVQTIEVEATLTQARTHVPDPSAPVFGRNRSCGNSTLLDHSTRISPLKNHGTILLSLLRLRRI